MRCCVHTLKVCRRRLAVVSDVCLRPVASPPAHSTTDEFIDLQYEENETKIIRFANYLRMVFQQPIPNADQSILESAAKALGTLSGACDEPHR